jgi:hypothetical protein
MYVHYTVVLVAGDPLLIYRGNLKSVFASTVYMYVNYTTVLVSGETLRSYRGNQNNVNFLCMYITL